MPATSRSGDRLMLRSLSGVAVLPSKSRNTKSLPVHSTSPRIQIAVNADALGSEAMFKQPAEMLNDGRFQFQNLLGQGQQFGRQ